MKHILLITTLFAAIVTSVAQTNDRYIEVAGKTIYQREVEHYEAIMELSGRPIYGGEKELSLEERKAYFFKKAKEFGLDKRQIRIADKKENDTRNLSGERIRYVVKTTDEQEIKSILLLGKIKNERKYRIVVRFDVK